METRRGQRPLLWASVPKISRRYGTPLFGVFGAAPIASFRSHQQQRVPSKTGFPGDEKEKN